MRKIITAIILTSSFIFSYSTVIAEDTDRPKHSRSDQHMQHMTKVLNLTDAQVKQIKPILIQKHERIRSIKEKYRVEISKYLTDDQKIKLDEIKKSHKRKRGE